MVDDPVTGHRTQLGPESLAVWTALQAGTALADLPLDADTLAWRLRQIDCALLLDSPRWRSQAALFGSVLPAEDLPLRIADGLRHRCIGCGSSCHGVHVGPVPLATHLAVEHHALWRDVPGAQRASEMFVAAGELTFMARRDDACVALRPDHGCAIHAAAGAAAKPGVCRQFPYTLTRTPDAIEVGLQLECRSLGASLASGAGDAEIEADLRALLAADPQLYDLPSAVPLVPGVFSASAELLGWLRPLVGRITADIPWRAALDDVCADALPRVAARARMVDDAWCPAPDGAPDPDALRAGLDDALAALIDLATGDDVALATLVRAALPAVFGGAQSATGWHPDAVQLLNVALRADLHGLEIVRDRDLFYGLGRTRLTLTWAEALARHRALTAARRVVHAQDVNDALVAITRALRTSPLDAALRRNAAVVRWLGVAAGRAFEPWMGAPV